MPIQELMISELPALQPVPSGEVPVSQMNGTARVTCKSTVQELVQSVAPRAHSHTPADIGLGNVNNTSDANKPVSGPTATALAGKIDSADARLTGIQRRKLVDIVWNVGGVTTIDPAMSPVFIDRSQSPSGSRKLQIATPPGNDDFEWFDVLLAFGGFSPISPVNWTWTNSAPVLGARDVIRFFRAPGIRTPGAEWVAMKMNA